MVVGRAVRVFRRPARLALAASAAPRQVVTFPAAAAHRALLARVLAESRVDTGASAPNASYKRDFLAWLARTLEPWMGGRSLHGWILWSLLGLVVVALLGLLAWLVRVARRKDAVRQPPATAAVAVGGDAARVARVVVDADATDWDAAAWRLELDRRLADGRVADALSAFWWWLARSLAGARAEANWTGRDLLRWSRRDDLRPLVRQLETLRYGPEPSSVAVVRRLVSRLEANLA